MALSFVQYTADGATDTFNIPFDYLSKSHIQVRVDGVLDSGITFPTAATVKTSSMPTNGAIVDVRRVTPNNSRLVDFEDGSLLSEEDLDQSALQNFYVMQELNDNLSGKIALDTDNQWDAQSKVIKNVANGVNPNDAINVSQTTGIVSQANAAKTAAEAAQSAAETAQGNTESARDDAIQAKDDAETAAASINMPDPSGNGLSYPRQKGTEDGFEYRTPTEVRGDINAQEDRGIPDIAGHAYKIPRVNDSETGFEYRQPYEVKADIGAITPSVRQTALTGPVDSEGRANFLTTGSGLSPLVVGSGVPLMLTFADGFDDQGAVDYMAKINYDSFVGPLPANNRSFIYGEMWIGFGDTLVPPQYGKRFPREQFSLLHFEGANGSTTITDEFENAWTAFGNAQLTTSDSKFGSSCLTLDGSGDYIKSTDVEVFGERWTIELGVKFNNTTVSTIFESVSASTFILNWDTSKLRVWVGDGYSWNIASALFSTTTLNINQWYHLAITYDGTNFKIYVDGTEDLNVAVPVSTSMANPQGLFVGIRNDASSSPLNGKIDELRITTGCVRYPANFTPPTAAFTPDVHWFNTNNFKMHYGGPNSWQIKQRLFLGEAETDGTDVIDVRSYAYRGEAKLVFDNLLASTNYLKSHNIGTTEVVIDSILEFVKAEEGYRSGERIMDYYNYYTSGAYGIMHGLENRNELFLRTAGTTGIITGNKFGAMGAGTDIRSVRLITNIRRNF